jgi:hypothetical protein
MDGKAAGAFAPAALPARIDLVLLNRDDTLHVQC